MSMLPLTFSCKETINNVVTDEEIKSYVLNYPMQYQRNPGTEISYNHMWEGTDTKNKYGPNYGESNRLYTYLIEYGEMVDNYYFVYINDSYFSTLSDWAKEYIVKEGKSYDCEFNAEANMIDGKYLLGAKKNNIDDFIVTHSDKFDQKYQINGYRMAMCLQTKTLTISQNASTKTTLNKKVKMYGRMILKYDESANTFTKIDEISYQDSWINSSFSYAGKKLETYPKSFEGLNRIYAPLHGFDDETICVPATARITDKGVLLPRIQNGYDLLNKEVELPITVEDVYQDHRDEFLDAFTEYAEEYSNDNTKYAYFDTQKVLNILK